MTEQVKIICALRVKNEERWLPAVLREASRAADCVLVLDDGSTDQTPEICRSFEKVLYRRYERPFDELRDRQELLDWALDFKPDWIMWLDGDEVLEECAGETIRREIRRLDPRDPAYTKFYFHILYFWDDPEYFRCEPGIYGEFWSPRLFTTWGQNTSGWRIPPKGHGNNLHCGNLPAGLSGRGKRIDVLVKHYGYLESKTRETKKEWYTRMDPAAAARGYYDHLTSGDGMLRARWQERPAGRTGLDLFYKGNAYYCAARPEVAALVPQKARHILDVGCGFGFLGQSLKAGRPDRLVAGVEVDPVAAACARLRLDEVVTGNIETLELDYPVGFFDCIILADVLEHLTNPWDTLLTLTRYLAADGTIVASLPNVRNLETLDGLLNQGHWRYQPAGVLDIDHLRFFTLRDVKRMFARANLVLQEIRGVPIPGLAAPAPENEALKELHTVQFLVRAGFHRPYVEKEKLTSVIIPVKNQLEMTALCLEYLWKHTPEPLEVIIVDNGSTDGTRDYLRAQPGLKVFFNGENLGFAAACNRGLAVARGDCLVLLNNDALVGRGWLSGLISHLHRNPGAGLAGPLSNCAGGAQTINFTPGSLDEVEEFTRLAAVENSGLCREADVLSGFCLLIKRPVLEAVGGLDVRFGPGNFDDDDFCLRARLAGFKLLVAEDVFVYHFGQRTFRGEGLDYSRIMRVNWEKFREKWGLPADFPPAARHTSPLLLNQPFDPSRHRIPLENYSNQSKNQS